MAAPLKTCLLTGGTTGIGFDFAQKLLAKGGFAKALSQAMSCGSAGESEREGMRSSVQQCLVCWVAFTEKYAVHTCLRFAPL